MIEFKRLCGRSDKSSPGSNDERDLVRTDTDMVLTQAPSCAEVMTNSSGGAIRHIARRTALSRCGYGRQVSDRWQKYLLYPKAVSYTFLYRAII